MDSIWKVSMMIYAYCPRCYRGDLGLWSLEDFRPTTGQRLLLSFGAKPYRCKACRTHFTSFLPRRRIRRLESMDDALGTKS